MDACFPTLVRLLAVSCWLQVLEIESTMRSSALFVTFAALFIMTGSFPTPEDEEEKESPIVMGLGGVAGRVTSRLRQARESYKSNDALMKLFDDIFQIPITTLKAVANLLTNPLNTIGERLARGGTLILAMADESVESKEEEEEESEQNGEQDE